MTAPLSVVCCKWNDPAWPCRYTSDHVNVLAESVERNLRLPHVFVCYTDDPAGLSPEIRVLPIPDTFRALGKCFRRLFLFSRDIVEELGQRFVSIDLDAVVVGDLTPLFEKPEAFKAWRDTQPPAQFNGSLFMVTPGSAGIPYHIAQNPSLFRETCDRASKAGMVVDDQAIMSLAYPNAPTWGKADGVFSYKNDILKDYPDRLPAHARIVFFHGNPKPWTLKDEWIKANWRRRKTLLVLGGASCVWEDLENVKKAYGSLDQFSVLAINDIGASFEGHLDYWVSLHPEKMHVWQKDRKGNKDYVTAAHIPYKLEGKEHRHTKDWGGSSGLFACKFGIEQGFEKIILCGVPMIQTPHFFGGKEWTEADAFFTAWEKRIPVLKNRVFSMSGRTRDVLGHPWL